ncbi:adenosine receptor A2b-like [Copidosoma floridanum]|uniref:adenosine receptor A2b-like n=1 Tax=Copidosoma floridanum TaxID=29053 RepID=UPI0006C9A2D3|nr:adenosine receptor A2b-like [Copidosoma floridanum]
MLEIGWPNMSGEPSAMGEPASSLDPLHHGAELNLPYALCEVLVAVAAVIGNGLVILVFARERKLRRRTNYYIISLATADLLVGLLAIPFAILASIGLPTNLHACLFTVSVLVVLCTISIFCLVAVSIDRYWAILHPMGYSRTMRTKTAIGIICVCWVAGTLVGFLPLFGWNAGHKSDEKCIFTEVMDYNYLVFLYFATIIFPALLIAAFYAHIYRVVVKQLQQIVTMNLGKRKENQGHGTMLRLLGAAQKREVKAAQNLSRIVAFFIICWFPLYTINCVKAFCPLCEVNQFILDFCIILSHVNSAGNPLLYAYHLKDFRAALKSCIHRLLFLGRADGKHASQTQAGMISVIQENKSSMMGSRSGSVGGGGLGSMRGRNAGSQQQLFQGGKEPSNNNRYPNLLKQVHESRMREMQAAAMTKIAEPSICIVKKAKPGREEKKPSPASPVDKTTQEVASSPSTSMDTSTTRFEGATVTALELKSYEFDNASLQFADDCDEEEEEVEDCQPANQPDSVIIIEADVNRSQSCKEKLDNQETDKALESE